MTKKEMLDKKIEQELEREGIRNKMGLWYSIMEDYYNIILLKEFNDETIEKMLSHENLLDNLATAFIDNDKVMDLQQDILQEFLNPYIKM